MGLHSGVQALRQGVFLTDLVNSRSRSMAFRSSTLSQTQGGAFMSECGTNDAPNHLEEESERGKHSGCLVLVQCIAEAGRSRGPKDSGEGRIRTSTFPDVCLGCLLTRHRDGNGPPGSCGASRFKGPLGACEW